MKVKELIEKLKEFDGEKEVLLNTDCGIFGTTKVYKKEDYVFIDEY